jgi:uncharacterized protein (UPF0548 family)
MMLRKPDPTALRAFIEKQAGQAFTYSSVGATATRPPTSYNTDRSRTLLGDGEKVFQAAKLALLHWEQFRLGWVEAFPEDAPLREQATVAVLARLFGLWWLNACRIVYVVDEPRRFGFAYGTLPDHAESGEERFLVEWLDDGSVWYDILAFSRPRLWLARVAFPLTRHFQARFRRDSAAAMLRAVGRQLPGAGFSAQPVDPRVCRG